LRSLTRSDLSIGEWKKAWRLAFEEAGVRYRWHDCRHSFISRLAENPHVSEETIKSLAGHVSKRMLERYSHIRTQAKRDAIAVLDGRNSDLAWAHDWAQSTAQVRMNSKKSLILLVGGAGIEPATLGL